LKQDALSHLADALIEDIAAASEDILLAEAREDFGDSGALALAFDGLLAGAKALAPQPVRDVAFGNLADALCEDIAATTPETLLAEAAEDYGDHRALAMEFDAAARRHAAVTHAPEIASAGLSAAGEEGRQALAGLLPMVPVAARLTDAVATLLETLMAPLRSRTALGAFATALLVAVWRQVFMGDFSKSQPIGPPRPR